MEIKQLLTEIGNPRQWVLSKIDDDTLAQLAHSCRKQIPMCITGIEPEVAIVMFESGASGNYAKAVEIIRFEQAKQKSKASTNIAMIKNDNKLWTPEQMCNQAISDNPNCKSALLIMIDKDDSSFFVHYASNLSKEEKIAFMEYQKAMFMREIV